MPIRRLATVPATGQPDFGSSLPLLNYDEPVQRVMNKRHASKPIVDFCRPVLNVTLSGGVSQPNGAPHPASSRTSQSLRQHDRPAGDLGPSKWQDSLPGPAFAPL
jgi:hypothetical protein